MNRSLMTALIHLRAGCPIDIHNHILLSCDSYDDLRTLLDRYGLTSYLLYFATAEVIGDR